MLADVSAKVADINTNITNVEATTDDDQRGRIDMTVQISDLKHLEKVMKSLKSVEGVLGVERSVRCRPKQGRSQSAISVRQRPIVRVARAEARAYEITAIASISTRASRGSLAACTVDRAGAGDEKNVA